MNVRDLIPSQVVHCWMHVGLALESRVTGKGVPYLIVPRKPMRTKNVYSLTRFIGRVLENNTATGILTLFVSPTNSYQQLTEASPGMPVSISYTAFSRIRLSSEFSHVPQQKIPADRAGNGYKRPGSLASSGSTDIYPYKTWIEVKLK